MYFPLGEAVFCLTKQFEEWQSQAASVKQENNGIRRFGFRGYM